MPRLTAYETHKLIKQDLPDAVTYWEANEKCKQLEFNFMKGDCNEREQREYVETIISEQ